MSFKIVIRGLVCAAMVAALAYQPTPAAVDVDLGVGLEVGDADLYFRLTSRYFDRDHDEVVRVARRVHDPDSVAVALFISRHSGRPVDQVLVLRDGGLGWWEIAVRFGVPMDVWFVPTKHDPGPPYGKAYGHWKKHGRRPAPGFHLSDAEVSHLVAARVLHEYYAVSPEIALQWRSGGSDLERLMTSVYRHRHGEDRGAASTAQRSGAPGNGQGHGKSKNKDGNKSKNKKNR